MNLAEQLKNPPKVSVSPEVIAGFQALAKQLEEFAHSVKRNLKTLKENFLNFFRRPRRVAPEPLSVTLLKNPLTPRGEAERPPSFLVFIRSYLQLSPPIKKGLRVHLWLKETKPAIT